MGKKLSKLKKGLQKTKRQMVKVARTAEKYRVKTVEGYAELQRKAAEYQRELDKAQQRGSSVADLLGFGEPERKRKKRRKK